MGVSLYDLSVGSYLQTLSGVSGFLDKGAAHFRDNNIDPAEVVDTRLYPDMLPFRFQIVSVCHHSAGAIDGVKAGVFAPPSETRPLDYAGLQQLVQEARDKLQAVKPEEVNA